MDFFERQRMARADTRRLLVLFAIAVLAIVTAVVGISFLFFVMSDADSASVVRRSDGSLSTLHTSWLSQLTDNAGTLSIIAGATLAIIAIASLVKAVQLRQGGEVVARSLGGTEIPAQSRDLNHQRLRNVVEEVAIASGVPVPKIFVLESEPGINAFAAGFGTADAAVAVTRGTLETLNRDELQGVIAHEFSHILNGDMRLNVRLIGWLAGITLLGIVGRILMRVRGRNSGGIVIFGVALFAIGAIGLFCARLIKAGISRKREYLADASAVQFTRQTQGIAGALKKIAASTQGSKLAAADGEEVSHLLFGDGVGYSRLLATHPPLEERIRALEPAFKLTDLTQWIRQQRTADAASAADVRRAPLPDIEFTRVLGDAGQSIPAPVIIAGLSAQSSTIVQPEDVVRQVGNPVNEDYRTANLLHSEIPPALDAAAHRPEDATVLLAGLLMAHDGTARRRQREELESRLGTMDATRAVDYAHACMSLHPMQRLPLAEITFASLRRRPAVEMQRARELVAALIAADGETTLFEYCLGYLLTQQIDEALAPGKVSPQGRNALSSSLEAVGVLLSLLANAGGREGRSLAERAFAAGVSELGPGLAPRFAASADWSNLDAVFAELDRLKPAAKSLLVAAMSRTVMHDGRLDVNEAELLRTACAALHCPLPPLLHEARIRLAAPPTVE